MAVPKLQINFLFYFKNNQSPTIMKKPQNYYCHRNTPQSQHLPTGYEIVDKIGEGAFGEVFKVFNSQTSSIEVMKCSKGESGQTMSKQGEIMSQMHSSEGFAKIKDGSKSQNFLIMTLLGQNLENILQRAQVNVVDMKRIAHQCLLRLKDLHERGYVHRDLKPENILLGNQHNPHKIYIVDFGLSSAYKKSVQVARKIYHGQLGTIKFCPLASHDCLEQFPKDDLQSLGYLLVYIMFGGLPWSRLPKGLSQKQKFDEIKRQKKQIQIQKLCSGVSCLRKYFRIVKAFKVGETIEYDKLIDLFQMNCQQQYCFSFCREDCFAKSKALCRSDNKENEVEEDFIIEASEHKMASIPSSFPKKMRIHDQF